MPAVDTLLALLVDTRNISARMAAAGSSEDEIRGAWTCARQAGYEATGLGSNRLPEAGGRGLARSWPASPRRDSASVIERNRQ